jgi:hypothetical protein
MNIVAGFELLIPPLKIEPFSRLVLTDKYKNK